MKTLVNRNFSPHGFARGASNYLIALALSVLALPGSLPAQTLLHRYSFISDASDSVGAANGTLIAPGNIAGSAVTITNGLSLPGGGGGGFSGYVALPGGILTTTTNLTIECWVTQNTGNAWATIWDFANDGNHNFELCPNPAAGRNNGNMIVAFTPNGGEDDLSTATLFPNGSEQYVSVTYNNSTLVGSIYLNGALDATTTLPNTTYAPGSIGGVGGTAQNWLGNDTYGDTQFQGTIYELRIWNGVIPQRQIAASAILGSSVLVTNLTPTSVSVSAGPTVVITGTEQAAVTVQLPQTGANNLQAANDATNWTSSNPSVLTVNSGGLITGVGAGTATVSAKVSGITGTSGSITVTPLALLHRYSFVSDATDSIGGANGTLVAPGNIAGTAATITNGLSLPGGGGNDFSGYLSLPSGILTNTTSLTIECWATQNAGNGWATIWDFANDGGHNFELCPDAGGGSDNGKMIMAIQPHGNEQDVQTPTVFPNGSEQYVSVTYNNSTLTGRVYTNGVLDGTTVYPDTTYAPGSIGGASGTAQNWLGNDTYGDTQFQGTVYELRIWNGALTPVYMAVSAAAGPSVIVTNVTPSSLNVSVNTSMVGAQTQQATVTGNFPQASGVTVTGGATNWISSNPGVLTVSSSGLITGVSGGNATVSATVSGVTATSASITVALTPPVITQGPVNQTVVFGDSATFSAQAVGGQLGYQWSNNVHGVIAGATNATLTLTNVAFTDAGTYSVFVTNTLGHTNASAVLTVVPQLLLHRYSFASDASDSVGNANGTIIGPNGGTAATIANGLSLPGGGGGGFSGYVALPNGILTNTTSLTIECWVTQNTANGWAEIWDFANDGSHNFGLIPDPQNNNGHMEVAFTPHGNEIDLQSGVTFPNATEQYVSLTYNNTNLTGNLYLNGAQVATTTFPDNTYRPGSIGAPAGTGQNWLGNDTYGDAQFQGTVYELRIWDGVVSPLYIAVSAIAGPSVLVTNLTPTSVDVTVTNTILQGEQNEQAVVVGNFAQASGVTLTGTATNWISSNPGVLTVSSSGLITAVSGGSATVSASVAGVSGTSVSITVLTGPPTITQEPEASETLLVGATLHASVSNIGVGPFTYKWFYNSSVQAISGATTSTLTIPDMQLTNAGNYSCTISNLYGSTNSTPVSVTVISPTPYQKDLLALSPLAYWPLNETSGSVAYDLAGGYNGTYIGGVSIGQPGVTNSGFGSPTYSANFDGATGYVDIPEGPFNITGAITVMAWVNINPANIPSFSDFVGHGDQSWRMTINGSAGHPGANDGGPPADANGPTSIIDGNWHLVAYTYTGITNEANNGSLYVDGELVANNSVFVTPAGDNLDVWIGGAPDYGTTFGTARLFFGNLADVAVLNYALEGEEIQGLFTGQGTLQIRASGPNVVLTWPSGVLLQSTSLTGPWTTNSAAVSPYSIPATGGKQFFRVLVSP
ncbi:MAG TPA: LamG-like jellyroll fold domain-containing protein [Verrucomicrobiae bacterium]|nr:LamG-like jellyroll fold domain-containing protein [Verrucomicrobiae bacterium]